MLSHVHALSNISKKNLTLWVFFLSYVEHKNKWFRCLCPPAISATSYPKIKSNATSKKLMNYGSIVTHKYAEKKHAKNNSCDSANTFMYVPCTKYLG